MTLASSKPDMLGGAGRWWVVGGGGQWEDRGSGCHLFIVNKAVV